MGWSALDMAHVVYGGAVPPLIQQLLIPGEARLDEDRCGKDEIDEMSRSPFDRQCSPDSI